jgi:GNAT superfamily N-acetyltransferase
MWHAYVEELRVFRPSLEKDRQPDGRFHLTTHQPAPPGDDHRAWYVILDAGQPAGFVLVGTVEEAPAELARPVIDLEEIWIAPDYRGKGLASAALLALVTTLRPGTLLVFVLTGNRLAQGMAEKLIEHLTGAPALGMPYSDPASGLDGIDFTLDLSSTPPRSLPLVWRPES